jgi:bla regulator protein blaR1
MKTLLLMAGVLTAATLAAQQVPSAPAGEPIPKFEVTSVKRNTSGDGFTTVSLAPTRPTFTNMAVRQLIVRAYGVQQFQVQGGPSWITGDRFDITAKSADDGITPAQMNLMLQSLLADRFKLRMHRETRQSDVYRLVKARPDGKLGDNLKPAAVDCSAMGRGRPGGAGLGATPVPPPTPPRAGGPAPGSGGAPGGCMMMMTPGRLQMGGQPMSTFVNTLGNQLGRPVLDETGLTGAYDLTVSYMPDSGGRGLPPGVPPPGAPDVPPIDPNAPALPTALQEQLGLKLESTKGPVEMIVIDSIEPPTED